MIRKIFAGLIIFLYAVVPVGAQNAMITTFGYVNEQKGAVVLLTQIEFRNEAVAEYAIQEENILTLLGDMDTVRIVEPMELKFKSAEDVLSYKIEGQLDDGRWIEGVSVFTRVDNHFFFMLAFNTPPLDLYEIMEGALSTEMMPPAPDGYYREQLDIRNEKKSI